MLATPAAVCGAVLGARGGEVGPSTALIALTKNARHRLRSSLVSSSPHATRIAPCIRGRVGASARNPVVVAKVSAHVESSCLREAMVRSAQVSVCSRRTAEQSRAPSLLVAMRASGTHGSLARQRADLERGHELVRWSQGRKAGRAKRNVPPLQSQSSAVCVTARRLLASRGNGALGRSAASHADQRTEPPRAKSPSQPQTAENHARC